MVSPLNTTPSPIILEIIKKIHENNLDINTDIVHRALKESSDNFGSLMTIGISCAQNNRLKDALLIFNLMQSYKSDDARIPYNIGLIYSMLGEHQNAISAYDLALKIKPDDFESLINKGSAYIEVKNYSLALSTLEDAIQIRSDIPEAWSNKSIALCNLKFYEEAVNACNKAIELNSNHHEAWSNKSLSLYKLSRYSEALEACDRALKIKPDYAEAWVNKGGILRELKRHEEALSHFDKALMYQPDYAEAWANKGGILHELKRHEEALSHFDKALMYQPDYAEGWVNKGIVLASHKELEQALFCFQRALEFNPNLATAAHGILDYYSDKGMFTDALNYAEENYALLKDSKKSNELLAYLHLSNDDKENALQSFNKSFLIHRQSTPAENKDSFPISESLIKHEFEQLSFLKSRQLLSQDGNNALSIIEGALKDPNKRIEELEKYKLLSALKSYHYLPDLPFPKKALGNNNYDHIESQYLNSDLKLAVIDNFLSEEALLNLRQFCEEANVWKTSFANGYVGSFIGSGFCSRALLAISEELKKMLPNIIGQNRLMQAWGFKYDQDMKGINLHADFAKINVNFWITPNDACMDLNSGGMVIYGTPVPETWGFDDYNCNPQKLREYLKFNNSTPVTVPYRMNRCVLFDSAYIHNTDHLSFKPGYENRRINCTLLYGRQLHL